MTRQRSAANQGIQVTGGNVTAEVIAVGEHATASKTVSSEVDHAQLLSALAALNKELEKLDISRSDRIQLAQHISEMQAAAKTKNSGQAKSSFSKFVEKFKQIGNVVQEAAGMVAPLRTIGGLLHVSLGALGLPI